MTASDYNKMCSSDNLRRAYKWIQSNPDALYKSFFRDAYEAYAAASEENLKRLRKHLLRNTYEPMHASKLYFPKASGILRPYTLLSVDDQIVYQSCVNIIAGKLRPKIKNRYFKNIFGHLYAGKSSPFFYLKWQKYYRAYTRAVIENVNQGYRYVANFDLTSFYDSIDHSVIEHFLKDIEIDLDLIDFLLTGLRIWTSSTWTNISNVIYHGHGIPQGPLASGLLSEVVLKHMDDRGTRDKRKSVKYLRYVDDIKVFSKDEKIAKQKLIALDLAAKGIGLFPQSSKININKVYDPRKEIKAISRPGELPFNPAVDQRRIRSQLLELCKASTGNVDDVTRFKHLLSLALPCYQLNKKLLLIMKNQPHLSANICSYFGRYKKMPRKSAEKLFDFLIHEDIYHSVQADVLQATLNNVDDPQKGLCVEYCYKKLFSNNPYSLPLQPSMKAAMIAWVLKNNKVTYIEMRRLLLDDVDWWVTKTGLQYLKLDQYGVGSYIDFLSEAMCSKSSDVSRIAALKIIEDSLDINGKIVGAHEAARLLLYAAGRIRRIGKTDSLIEKVLCKILDIHLPPFNWVKLLGKKHKHGEQIAFDIKKYYESNINACIVTLDSLCDLIFKIFFEKYVQDSTYGHYGHMLKNQEMIKALPQTCASFKLLHELRLQSFMAHPRDKRGNSTRRLKHWDFNKIKPALRSAFVEICKNDSALISNIKSQSIENADVTTTDVAVQY